MGWRRFFQRRRADAELTEEMGLYLAEEIDENIARGMSREEAQRRAYVKFGNPQQVRESLGRQNSLAIVDDIWRDLRYATRALSRSPGFTAVAVLVMALGIGSNVALFTVVRSVLLKPLPYRDSERLVSVYQRDKEGQYSGAYLPIDAGSFAEWKSSAKGIAQMSLVSAWQQYNVSAEGGKLPEKIDAAWCSWNFFPTLGVAPVLGRGFSAADDRLDAEATVILTAPFWKRRYDSNPDIIGKRIWLNAKPYTVIGVLPSWFKYSGAFAANTVQMWTAASHEASSGLMSTFEDHRWAIVARLLPDVTLAELVSQLDTVQKQIKANHPGPSVRDSVS